jgi:hypothetical protein
MWKPRIIPSTLFLLLALGTLAPQFAQDASTNAAKSDKDHATLMGLARTINTAEVGEFSKYGSYASWPILLTHQSEYLNGWLTQLYSQEKTAHFDEVPEILPGWNLRLNTQTDGKGYVLLLEDANDKTGFAAVSDERGIIRESKYIR